MQLIYLPLEHVFPCYDNTDSIITDNCGSRPTPSPVCSPTHPLIQPTKQVKSSFAHLNSFDVERK